MWVWIPWVLMDFGGFFFISVARLIRVTERWVWVDWFDGRDLICRLWEAVIVALGDYIYFFLDVVGCNLLWLWWLGVWQWLNVVEVWLLWLRQGWLWLEREWEEKVGWCAVCCRLVCHGWCCGLRSVGCAMSLWRLCAGLGWLGDENKKE